MQLSFEENRLEVEVAFRYYYEQKTQGEIAKEMGLSRVKVQRILQKCLDTGIVRITIQDPLVRCVSLEKELQGHFGLAEVHVVMTPSNDAYVNQQVALKGAYVFDQKISEGMTVGVAWGRMVNEIVKSLQPRRVDNVKFVSMVGGLTTRSSLNPFSVINRFGELYGAEVCYLSAPAVVEDIALKEAIAEERSIIEVFEKMDDIDVAVVGIGGVTENSTLFETGYLSREELECFRSNGAVGEVLLFHYNIEGEIIEADFHNRLVGIGVERLRSIDTVIGVAQGQHKIESIIGAIRSGFINILITDEDTASGILEFEKSRATQEHQVV